MHDFGRAICGQSGTEWSGERGAVTRLFRSKSFQSGVASSLEFHWQFRTHTARALGLVANQLVEIAMVWAVHPVRAPASPPRCAARYTRNFANI